MKLTSFLNKLQKSNKSLEEMTDAIVKKIDFDNNEHYYGDLGCVEDSDDLCTMREILFDFIEKDKSQEFIAKFHLLLEVERELTLREE
jgi:hypothetical protein